MNIAVIISLIVLVMYIVGVCLKHGVPETLSDSYYYLKSPVLFTLTLWIVGIGVLPKIMEVSAPYEIIGFVGVFGIMLVGAAPRFKDYERTVHIIGASIAGIFSQLWTLIVGYPLLLLAWIPCVIILVKSYIENREELMVTLDSYNFIFWGELTCFFTLYANLLLL